MTQPVPSVTVTASVERDVTPDLFTLTATAVGTGRQIKAALTALGDLYSALEEAAAALPDAVEIRHRRIHTERAHPPEYPARATRSLVAQSHDLGLVGIVADAFAAVGSVEIDGPEWSLDPDNAVSAALQSEVVGAARERAARYAAAVDAALGSIVEIRDTGRGGYAVMDQARMSYASTAPQLADLDYEPTPISVSASVQATWELVPTG